MSKRDAVKRALKRAFAALTSPEAMTVLTVAALTLKIAAEIDGLRKNRRKAGFKKHG